MTYSCCCVLPRPWGQHPSRKGPQCCWAGLSMGSSTDLGTRRQGARGCRLSRAMGLGPDSGVRDRPAQRTWSRGPVTGLDSVVGRTVYVHVSRCPPRSPQGPSVRVMVPSCSTRAALCPLLQSRLAEGLQARSASFTGKMDTAATSVAHRQRRSSLGLLAPPTPCHPALPLRAGGVL